MADTPGNKLTWKIDQAMITRTVEELKKISLQVYDAVGKLSPDEINYDNVIKVKYLELHQMLYGRANFNLVTILPVSKKENAEMSHKFKTGLEGFFME